MRAIVTIIDEKTGHVFEKDKLLEPYIEQRDPRFCCTTYVYRFSHSIEDDYFKRIFDQQMVEPNEELLKTIESPNPGYTLTREEIYKALEERNGIHED